MSMVQKPNHKLSPRSMIQNDTTIDKKHMSSKLTVKQNKNNLEFDAYSFSSKGQSNSTYQAIDNVVDNVDYWHES